MDVEGVEQGGVPCRRPLDVAFPQIVFPIHCPRCVVLACHQVGKKITRRDAILAVLVKDFAASGEQLGLQVVVFSSFPIAKGDYRCACNVRPVTAGQVGERKQRLGDVAARSPRASGASGRASANVGIRAGSWDQPERASRIS